jgi:hypothetical protein
MERIEIFFTRTAQVISKDELTLYLVAGGFKRIDWWFTDKNALLRYWDNGGRTLYTRDGIWRFQDGLDMKQDTYVSLDELLVKARQYGFPV